MSSPSEAIVKKLCSEGRGNKVKKVERNNDLPEVEKNNDLPSDVLGIIFRELDFDDLFEFAGVCKSWRIGHKHYLSDFMKSQSPFIVETALLANEVCSFLSVPDLKIYRSTMQYLSRLHYVGSSSGYLIMAGFDKQNEYLLLKNPFTRRMKKISTSALEGKVKLWVCRALLAFVKGSEEFVIVVSALKHSSYGLHVYQSRNSSWISYSIRDRVVALVVLHNTIYALTSQKKIGVLSLNSARVKFLNLKNTPEYPIRSLFTSDGQLLVLNFEPGRKLNVYKIDFSTMEYVKLETLGDLAIFYSLYNCHALSNPGRWGYDSNSVYYITTAHGRLNPGCEVYSWNNELKKRITRDEFGARPQGISSLLWRDWCFRHEHDEVDYSLVD
ncbi:uncharacterized protein LOC130728144 [Lotus japonicus]|uniref:uncharacterized protein LOC130728144 n=1 Tax=Lotus japonicus TaxID=34305 RepID=UPI00258D8A48|nr:uncharacterized protein LOC130728144 [Lotus japonicus]